MKVTFASYVGNQINGINSNLDACMKAEDQNGNKLYSIEKLLLSYTDTTKENAKDIEKHYKENASFPVYLYNNEVDFENAIKASEKVMFLASGGQNYAVAQTISNHYKDISYVVSSDRNEVSIFNLEDNYDHKTIPFKLITPEELIASHPGITIENESSPSQLNDFLKYYNITLPSGFIRDSALQNVKINGIHCDLVWNDGSNRLVFLTDFTRFDLDSEETANNLKKDLVKVIDKIVSSSHSSDNKSLRKDLLSAVEKAVDSRSGEDILNLQTTFNKILKKYNGNSVFENEIDKVIGNTKKVIRQNLTRIASTKVGKGLHDLYDRRWYVVCANEKDIQHIKLESRGKMTPFKPYGLFNRQNGTPVFAGLQKNSIQATNQNLKRSLTKLIKKNEENETPDVPAIKISSDTLILALGSDIITTINATIAHRKNNKIKNVIIVATVNDSEIKELADNTKDYFEKAGLHTQILPTDINGSNILKSLVKESSATNIHVNITPGSKGQTASLSYWASKNEVLIWSILTRTAQLKCISDENKDSDEFLVEACDIKDYLKILYPYADLFRDDTEEEKKFMSLLLKQMRACLNENIKWEQVRDSYSKFIVGGISLSFRRDYSVSPSSNNKKSNRGSFILKDENNNVFTYEVDGGDWFESLTSQALREAGCNYSYARTRLPFEEKLQEKLEKTYQDVFRLDMDAIASWHGVHVMVSCKAQELGTGKANPLDRVAVEAQDVTASLNRFAIPVVCYLYKGDTTQFVSEEDNKKKTIPVIDWTDLCQSEKLKEILENARLNKSTNKRNSNNQTA